MSGTDGPHPTSIYVIDNDYIQRNLDRRREVIEWLDHHGINPMWVPLDAQVHFLDENDMEIQIYDMPNGVPQWDDEKKEARTRWMLVPMRSQFPMDVLR